MALSSISRNCYGSFFNQSGGPSWFSGTPSHVCFRSEWKEMFLHEIWWGWSSSCIIFYSQKVGAWAFVWATKTHAPTVIHLPSPRRGQQVAYKRPTFPGLHFSNSWASCVFSIRTGQRAPTSPAGPAGNTENWYGFRSVWRVAADPHPRYLHLPFLATWELKLQHQTGIQKPWGFIAPTAA